MAKKRYKLTWRPHDNRWTKMYKGRRFYFSAPAGKIHTYHKALQDFKKWQAEVDREIEHERLTTPFTPAWTNEIDYVTFLQDKLAEWGDSEKARIIWQVLEDYKRLSLVEFAGIADRAPSPVRDVTTSLFNTLLSSFNAVPAWMVAPDWQPASPKGPAPWDAGAAREELAPDAETIGELVDNFLTHMKSQIGGEGRGTSEARYLKLRACLSDDVTKTHKDGTQNTKGTNYLNFVSRGTPLEKASTSVSGYLDRVRLEVNQGIISDSYGKDRLQAVRQLMKWAYRREYVDALPRILDQEYTITVRAKEVETFTVSEIAAILDACSNNRVRLYVLLSLNCGMQGQDIADLRHDEVNWRKGMITRKRSKTASHESTPTVTYKLWPECFVLLRSERSDHESLALVNKNGKPLITSSLGENDKGKKSNNVRSALHRVIGAAGIKKKTPSLFRKTGASLLAEHSIYKAYAQFYLAHSARTVADKHYVRPSQDQFDLAIEWLGKRIQPGPSSSGGE